MYRFYVDENKHTGNQFIVTGEDVNHIKNVLRLKPHDNIVLCNTCGTDYICEIEGFTDNKECVCNILKKENSLTELPVKIILYQGIPKKDKFELIVQKCTELGVSEIVPVKMKRSIAKIEDEKAELKKALRWSEIARAAAMQSGRGIIPKIGKAVTLKEAVTRAKEDSGFIAVPYENANGMKSLKEFVDNVKAEVLKDPESVPVVSVFIGPEGGFDISEIEFLKESNGTTVSLGKRILRTETAGFVISSIIMYELECMNDSIS